MRAVKGEREGEKGEGTRKEEAAGDGRGRQYGSGSERLNNTTSKV